MVYVTSTTANALFPKVVSATATKLVCTNQITHKVYEIPVSDSVNNAFFYTFNLSNKLTGFDDGQYDYKIVDTDSKVLATGILQFGEYTSSTSSYSNTKEIIQYKQ